MPTALLMQQSGPQAGPQGQSKTVTITITGEHEHVISGYSLLKGIGDGEPIASDRFTVGGHEWVLLFYPDGKRSTSDPNAPATADDPYAALFVALIGEGPRPQGVVTSVNGRVVRAFHRFTLVDQSENGNRHVTKGRQRDQGAVKISCARQDPNARNCHGYRKFVRRSVLESPNNGYLKHDTIVIRYEIELVVTSGGALNRPKQLAPAVDVSAFPTLGDQIKALLTSDAEKTDVVFEVERQRFPAHSLVVAARSSAFRAMLRTGAEMREGSEGVIRIGDVRAPVFRVLLAFLYSDELPDGTGRNTSHEFAVRRGDGEDDASLARTAADGVGRSAPGAAWRHPGASGVPAEGTDRDRVFGNRGGHGRGYNDTPEMDVAMTQHLLVAADRFDLTRLRAMCEAKLCDTVEVETAATTLALAEQNNALALKQACLQFVASHLGEVMLTEGYKHMEQSCPNLAGELLKTVAQQNQAKAAAEAANAGALAAPAPHANATLNLSAMHTANQHNLVAMQTARAAAVAAAAAAATAAPRTAPTTTMTLAGIGNIPAPAATQDAVRRSPPVPSGRVAGPRYTLNPMLPRGERLRGPSPDPPGFVGFGTRVIGIPNRTPADHGQDSASDDVDDDDADEDDDMDDPEDLPPLPSSSPPQSALDARHPSRPSRAWVAPNAAVAGATDEVEVSRGRGRAAGTRGVGAAGQSGAGVPAQRGGTNASPSAEDGAAAGSGRRVRRRVGN